MLAPLLALALIQEAGSRPYNGAALVNDCRAAGRIIDNPTPGDMDAQNSNACIGYLDGFVAGINFYHERVCVAGATKSTVAKVYVVWMEKHPKFLDAEPSVGLLSALLDSYPCPVKSK